MVEALGSIHPADGEGARGLSERHWAVLRYADAMTRDVKVPDEVWEGVRRVGFRDREVVELTGVVAAYNCVSRFLVALDVGQRNGKRNEG
jgi:alkylhydroperoxidase family enzyme